MIQRRGLLQRRASASSLHNGFGLSLLLPTGPLHHLA